MNVRDLIDADWESVVAIKNLFDRECLTADELRKRQSHWIEGDPRMTVVAVEDNGEIVAYARSNRRRTDPDGKFNTSLFVHPKAQGKGLGRELYARNEAFAVAHGATNLGAIVNDWEERGLDFAAKNGFYPVQHLFESKLDLTTFDATPFHLQKAKLETEGYRFLTLEEAGDTIENWQRLHVVDSISDLDTPGYANWGPRTFERYLHEIRDGVGVKAAGIFMVEREGQLVGLHIVKPHGRPNEMQTDYSGMLREHRGKGLAQVLKALGAEYCRACGAEILSTHNDERNGAMLAINAKFGFVVEPGFRGFRKDLE